MSRLWARRSGLCIVLRQEFGQQLPQQPHFSLDSVTLRDNAFKSTHFVNVVSERGLSIVKPGLELGKGGRWFGRRRSSFWRVLILGNMEE